MEVLTQRQKQIVRFFARQQRTQGRPPTIREICDRLKLGSTHGVHQHLRLIAQKGYIEHAEVGRARGWRLTEAGAEFCGVTKCCPNCGARLEAA